MLWYEDGTWSIEDTGYKETLDYFVVNPAFDLNGILHVTSWNHSIDPYAVWIYQRNDVGNWTEEQLTDVSVAKGSYGIWSFGLAFSNMNKAILLLERGFTEVNPYLTEISLLRVNDEGLQETEISKNNGTMFDSMQTDSYGVSIFYDDTPEDDFKKAIYHTRLEDTSQIEEVIYSLPANIEDAGLALGATATDNSGKAYVIISGFGGELGVHGQIFAKRLDPHK